MKKESSGKLVGSVLLCLGELTNQKENNDEDLYFGLCCPSAHTWW
jgi:hypothetical protein